MIDTPAELRCGVVAKNRLCKAATSEQLGDARTNEPTKELIALYERWGRGGAGIVITGNVIVSRSALEAPRNVVVDEATGPLEEWATKTKAGGAVALVQLSHAGRQSPLAASWRRPLAPSAVTLRLPGVGFQLHRTPRAMSTSDIDKVVKAFATAARRAVGAGFDGVQVHSAHGYLLSQFLSPTGNIRNDEYGNARTKLLLDVLEAVRLAVGPTAVVGLKLNMSDFEAGGFDEAACGAVLEALPSHVDFVELSAGTYASGMACMGDPDDFPHRAFVDMAHDLRRDHCRPSLLVMVTGGIVTRDQAAQAAERGFLVGLARPFCIDPELALKWLDEAHTAEQLLGDGLHRTGLWSVFVPRRFRRILIPGLRYGFYMRQLWRIARGQDPAPLSHATFLFTVLPRSLLFEPARLRPANALALFFAAPLLLFVATTAALVR